MRSRRLFIGLPAALVIFTVSLLVTSGWAATRWNEKVLHSFNNNGTDGYEPYFGSLIFDATGNLYGTTYEGGMFGLDQRNRAGCWLGYHDWRSSSARVSLASGRND